MKPIKTVINRNLLATEINYGTNNVFNDEFSLSLIENIYYKFTYPHVFYKSSLLPAAIPALLNSMDRLITDK